MKNTQKGFSLIELMVVVAIIGILATVAVPQVNKFMARAKQAEAKSSLAGIYTAAKGFFTEYGVFQKSFQVIGYAPEGRVKYDAGWAAGGAPACPPSLTAGCGGQTNIKADCTGFGAGQTGCGCTTATGGTPECQNAGAVAGAMTANTFTAQAIGNVYQAQQDTWTIDNLKQVNHTVNGVQ